MAAVCLAGLAVACSGQNPADGTLPQSVDETFSRLIDGLDLMLSSPRSPAGEPGRAGETA
ncbi:MAG TPA: hypothetical protein VGR98_17330 [Streptosporangiaceae bacterium]|nr:hypothetical protein [Streptosporangiaceae bacterium]